MEMQPLDLRSDSNVSVGVWDMNGTRDPAENRSRGSRQLASQPYRSFMGLWGLWGLCRKTYVQNGEERCPHIYLFSSLKRDNGDTLFLRRSTLPATFFFSGRFCTFRT